MGDGGDFGAALMTLVWGVVLFALFGWTQRNMLTVPGDRKIMIVNRYSGAIVVPEGPIAPPLVPAVERRLAVIPLYELADIVRVEKVNTKRQNVDVIEAQIHYKVVDARRAAIASREQVPPDRVPADAVTGSGSGIDPQISPAYAELQVPRVARETGLSEDRVRELVAEHTEGRQLGFLGAARVDVPELNVALGLTAPGCSGDAAGPTGS